MAKIGLVMALDGEKEFSAKLKAATAAVKLAKEQLNDINDTYKDSANARDTLVKKEEALVEVYKKLEERQKAANEGYNKANESFNKVCEKVEEYTDKVNQLKEAQEEAERSQGKESDAYKNTTKELAKAEQELQSYSEAQSRAAARVATWQTAQTKAGRELRNANKELEENKKYLEEAKNSSDGLAKSIDNTGKKIKVVEEATDDLGDELKDTADDLSKSSEEAAGFGDALDKSFGKNRIAQLGLDLLKKMAKEAFDAIKEGLKVGIDFESQMSRVGAISGATGEEFQQLKDKAEQLGLETVYSATESAEAMEQMALAGWRTQDIISGIDGVLSLAASSGMSIGRAAEYVSDNIHAWGEESSYASEMADIMAAAMSHSSMTTEDLGEAYGKTAATAHALGFDIADVTAVLMGMANQGRKGGEAGSSLNTILTRLATNTSHCADQLGDLGVQIYDSDGKMRSLSAILDDTAVVWETLEEAERNALAKTVAGTRQFNAFSMVMKSVSDEAKASGRSMEDFKRILENSEGSADRMADTMLNNVKGSVTLLKDALEGLAIVLFDKINGPLKQFIDYLAAAVTRTANFFDGSKDSTSAMADSIAQTRDALKGLKEQTDQEADNAEKQSKRAEILIDYLRELNSEEELSEYQKQRVKEIVSELNDIYPDLTFHIDEQTGKVKESNEQLKRYAENLKEALIAEAMMSKANGYADIVADAKVALAMGEQELERAKKRKDFYEGYYTMLTELSAQEFSGATTEELISRQTQAWEDAYKAGTITLEEYQNGLDGIATSFSDINAGYLNKFLEQSGTAGDSIKELTEQVDGLRIQYNEATGDLEAVVSITDKYTSEAELEAKALDTLKEKTAEAAPKALNLGLAIASAATGMDMFKVASIVAAAATKEEAEATDKATRAAKDFQDSQDKVTESVRGKTKAISASKAEQMAAERAEEAARITRQSAQDMADAWDALVADTQNALGQIDPKKAWDGGGVTTTWTLIDNLDSQIAGMEEYSANLDKLKDHIGKEVSPEFAQYIEEMGLSGADFLSNILLALESEGGPERVQAISEKYAQAMDIEGVLAEQLARDRALWEKGLLQFGSSESDFDALRKAVNNGFSKVSDDTKQDVLNIIDEAQKIGVKLPENLVESINSGDISNISVVKDDLQASIIGLFQGLGEKLGEDGGGIPEELAQGIADGSKSIEDAYNEILALIAEINPQQNKIEEAADTTVVDPFITSLENAKEEIGEAAKGLVEEAATAVEGEADQFEAAGKTTVSKFAEGVTAQKPVASAAVATMVAAAINDANAQTSSADTLGYNIAAGVVRGINNGKGAVADAGARMIREAITRMQREADTHSPSKKTEKLIGVQLPAGITVGIKKGTKKTADAAAAMVGKVLYDAQHVMDTKGVATAANIAAAWNSILSAELNKPKKNNKQFQLSWYTESGSGKNKKKVKKDAETYYGEVMQIAQTYFSNIQVIQEMSEREELAYWQKIVKHVGKGTQAWYDAQSKIQDIKRSMGSADVASKILSEFGEHYEVSAAAEVTFWETVKGTYKEGSADYIQAQNEFLKAQKNLNDKEAEINKKHSDALVEANKEREESIKSLIRTTMDAYDIFDEFESEAPTPEELLYNIEAQAAGYEKWQEEIKKLAQKGLSDDLMQEIINKGVSGVAGVAALNMLSEEDLKRYQEAYNRKYNIAREYAESDESIKKAYEEAVKKASDEQKTALAELKKTIDPSLLTLANNLKKTLQDEVTAKIVAAIEAKQKTPTTASPQNPTTPTQSRTQVAANMTETQKINTIKANKDRVLDVLLAGIPVDQSKGLPADVKSDPLKRHIAMKYGVFPVGDVASRVAQAVGLPAGISPEELLRLLQAAGFARGTKKLEDLFAWMDENGIGSEMVIRKSDGARLNTNVKPGDAIVPAVNTDNLWNWSKVSPQEMLAGIAMQNAMTQQYVNDMAKSINVARLNDSLGGVSAASNAMLGEMMSLMASYLPYLAQRTRISIDGRKFVEATSDYTSRDLATRMRRRMV